MFFPRQSFRRDALDAFLERNLIHVSGNVLDIGGQRHVNRGRFKRCSLETASDDYIIINTEEKFSPDICCRFEDAHFESKKRFDTVICTETFEYFDDPKKELRKIDALLADGGHFILSIPFLVSAHSDSTIDHFRLNPIWVEAMMNESGYTLVDNQHTNLAQAMHDLLRSELHRSPPKLLFYKFLSTLLFMIKTVIWLVTKLRTPRQSHTGGIWLWQKKYPN